MKVKAVSVKAFELFDCQGTSLGLFLVESEWQGMLLLRPINGDAKIIINASEPSLGGMFSEIFGTHRGDFEIVKASPDLVVQLKEAASARGVAA